MAANPKAKYVITADDQTAAAWRSAMQRADAGGKRLAGAIKGALAGVGVGAVFGAIVRATSEAEKAFAQLEAAVKSTGGSAGFTAPELAEMASGLQAVTTHADDAIQSMQAVLLTFTQIRGPEFKAAQEAILDVATRLGTDLKSAALQVGKALNDPIKGATALARSGIQLTDSQKSLIQALQDTGDMAGAQRIILQELQVQFGGAAQAARDNFGGALLGLQNAFGDLLEAKSGLPGATAAINELTDTLNDPDVKAGFDNLVSGSITALAWLGKLGAGAAEAAKGVGEFFAELAHGPDTAFGRMNKELQELVEQRNGLLKTIRFNEAAAEKSPVFQENFRGVADRAKAELDKVERRMSEINATLLQLERDSQIPAPQPPEPKGKQPAAAVPGTGGIDRRVDETLKLQRAIQDLESYRSLVDETDRATQEWMWSTVDIEKTILDLPEPILQLSESLIQADAIQDEFSRSMFNNFSDLFMSIGTGSENMADAFINAIKRMLSDQATLKLFEALGSLGNQLSGKSGVSGWIGAGLAAMFGGTKAEGGPIQQGKWYIAGEHGPEPIWGGGPGAFAMGYGSGGSGGNITVVNQNTFHNVQDLTDQKMAVYARRIQESTLAAVRDGRRRA